MHMHARTSIHIHHILVLVCELTNLTLSGGLDPETAILYNVIPITCTYITYILLYEEMKYVSQPIQNRRGQGIIDDGLVVLSDELNEDSEGDGNTERLQSEKPGNA